jgi:ubiquinone/menaquinone biosynthesis C-methylase UbiE
MDRPTIEAYDKMSLEYDARTSDFWQRYPRTITNRFADLIHGRVLDIGSGPGRDAEILRNLGLDVVCLDASKTMVEMTRGKGFESVVGDFSALPFGDASFEAVWAYTSLIHEPKAAVTTALQEIHRVLVPDGAFALGLIEGGEEGYQSISNIPLPRWFSFYTQPEAESLVTAHGFTILHFEEFQPGSKKYLNFICRKD